MIDLLYHATIYYEIRKFVQESDPTALTYKMVIEKAKAHERNFLEYKDHQASHGGANSVPSYNNPLLSAHALSKRRPSGRGNNGQCCGKCGKSHERGNCPAYGKTCNRCQGINHFKAVCRSKVAAKTGQSPHRSKKSQLPRHGSTGSYNGQGKGGGNHQHKDNTQVVSFHYKGIYRSCQWLLESLDLCSLCWLIFGGKSTECGKFKAG